MRKKLIKEDLENKIAAADEVLAQMETANEILQEVILEERMESLLTEWDFWAFEQGFWEGWKQKQEEQCKND